MTLLLAAAITIAGAAIPSGVAAVPLCASPRINGSTSVTPMIAASEKERRFELKRILRFVVRRRFRLGSVRPPRDGPSREAREDRESAKRGCKFGRERSVEERYEQDEPHIHRARSCQDAAREQVRAQSRILPGLPGQHDRGQRRRVRTAENRR